MKYFCKICQAYIERDKKKCCPDCGANLKEASIAPDTIIAGFKVIKEIGRGSNGIVYLAEQTSLDRQVALKILPVVKAEDPSFVKDFLKEARAAARLNHPNIIQIYDAGVTNDGVYFLAMELIDGRSLEDLIQNKGPLKSKNAIKIMIALAKAMEYSWKKEHLFHGDIKPDNVMIRKDGQTKLADFGLAKTIFDERSDEIMATPMYAPPEVIRAEHKKIGFKSDMYSFGITLYETLCGVPPFNEADCQKVLTMHLQQKHIPLTEQQVGTDKALSDLIDKLLSKDIKKRPQDWTEVVEKLETVQAVQAKKAGTKFRLRLVVGIIVLIILSILATIEFFYYNSKEESPQLVKRLVIQRKPTVRKRLVKKVDPAPVIDKENDKSHIEFKKLLQSSENIAGDILRVSRLNNRVVNLQKNNTLSKIEQTELRACISKINIYIRTKRQEINKKELINLNLALKKEEITNKKNFVKIARESSLIARKNKVFAIVSKFLSHKRSKQAVKTLQSLLSKTTNLDKKLKEYKSLIFLLKVLPRKYKREAAVFENLDQLIGKTLPWKIKNQEYSISGGSWQNMHLKTQLSEGVFSRKKISANSIGNFHWALLVDEFLIKEDIKITRKNTVNTACWLLLYGKDKLFKDFINKYYPDNIAAWFNCRELLSSANKEVKAYTQWRNIVTQMEELNPRGYEFIDDFKTKYADTEVYKNAQTALIEYEKIVSVIYPDAFMKRLDINSMSLKSSSSKIFSVQNRYRFLDSVPPRERLSLRTLFNKKLRSIAGNREFVGQLGVFRDVPCGKVYSWMVTSSRPPKLSLLRYTPALLDVDNWSYIKKIFNNESSLELGLSKLKGNPELYPFSLYCNGLIALRFGKWEILDKIFADYKKLLLKDDIDSRLCRSLFADLALKTRGDQYAWEVLNKYKFEETIQDDEIIIPLLKIQTLLTQNPVDQSEICKLINDTKKHFSKLADLSSDLKVLELLRQFICAEFEQGRNIEADLFKNTAYPHLYARIWLEAAARDKILQRNSIKIPALIKAARSVLTASAFRSELFQKIINLELGYKSLTPTQLCANLKKILLELKPCATNSYPSMLTLLFAFELLNNKLTPEKLAPFAKAYTVGCPIFSPVEEKFYKILYSSKPINILIKSQQLNPIIFQRIYLYMLAAAMEKQSGYPERYILKLKSFRKDLRWTEQLLLNRFIQLLENKLEESKI